ncbi:MULTISPECIES: argininosuccinate lyase [Robiginitalea]|uniref:Argininosuccinate lyase n=1 Tax=Robiginitalea biformata (strain ATCC BAA-864 / DSM 15991 / KCTC 12146 / HTCC2501) TaxID=313596 RepID=A4CJ54_ROBBH|nr:MULTISPECIES: argininosuccinate lyase [Robiginitalea]EAR16962.1 argininosuccinate lyase [Robiginitalea biformata HTCC2501]MDC6352834.1 argininosuccinate lyase [Robiginitalea sp. PM2]MDC6374000.1 argininosuccinate lyase [Robiginitalea sp. SP8]
MKLWDKGSSPDEKTDLFTVGNDRELDLLLVKYDLQASRAHARMLGKIGLLTEAETADLVREIDALMDEEAAGRFTIEAGFEDMHSKIEYLLTEKLGDTGKKIHTARSRNDQVLVALQLYLKDALSDVQHQVRMLFDRLLELAEKHQAVPLPGYTHLQVAMPSSFGLWFSAYAESLIDDVYLLEAARRVADQNPLGSAAGYGSSFPIDREFTTEALGFETMKYNVVAAQMGRGKVERTAATALAAVAATLGKLAMDICLYMSQNFGFVSFPDKLTTGSSIMPHKKNPDIFELIRGKCNLLQAVPGQLGLLTTNLPSGYHRDLQLTKDLLLPAVENLKSCLEMAHTSLGEIQVREDILDDPKYDYLYSVDTLNQRVLEGVPFRDAYRDMAAAIADGSFSPVKGAAHTHAGSLGNLCLDRIADKMAQACADPA